MEKVVHIIPSGLDISLCGVKVVEGFSIGSGCNCKKCLQIAKKIIKNAQQSYKNN